MPELKEQLSRWTAAGIIDASQAARIESAERASVHIGAAAVAARPGVADSQRAAAGARSRRALPLIAEVLGYLGAAIAISAGFEVMRQLWPHMTLRATLPFIAIAAVGLLVAGMALRNRDEPAFSRLRSVLWLLATAAVTVFVAVLTSQVVKLSDGDAWLSAEAGGMACAIALWWRSRSVPQHLAMFALAVALVPTGIAQIWPGVTLTWLGAGIWALSAGWGIAAYRGYLAPATAGLAAGAAGLLIGAGMTMESPAGQALALLTVAGLLAAGIVTGRVLLIGAGAAGTLWVVPDTVSRYLPGSVAAPLAVAIVGLVLLGVALRLASARRKA